MDMVMPGSTVGIIFSVSLKVISEGFSFNELQCKGFFSWPTTQSFDRNGTEILLFFFLLVNHLACMLTIKAAYR